MTAHAVEYHQFYNIDSLEEQLFPTYQVVKNHKYWCVQKGQDCAELFT